MNLGAVPSLGTQALPTLQWYRVVRTAFLTSALHTGHTRTTPSRFYDPHGPGLRFRTLYLSDDPLVAQFEAQVLLGSPWLPGASVPGAAAAWAVVRVSVVLSPVPDLSDTGAQTLVDTSVQELTGDWQGYRRRSPLTNVTLPVGTAPTQDLGEALYRDPRNLEGFLAVSARVPSNRNLVVFPDHLGPHSYVQYEWDDGPRTRRYRVDSTDPDGREMP